MEEVHGTASEHKLSEKRSAPSHRERASRAHTRQFDEPKAQALFETSAEVLGGLRTEFQHYESGAEAAMREPRGH